MVGSDSNIKDIQRFPPFIGLENSQKLVDLLFNEVFYNRLKYSANSYLTF